MRLSLLCNKGPVGNEFHFISEWWALEEIRKKHLYMKNVLNFSELMSFIILNLWENCVKLFLIFPMLSFPLSCFSDLILYFNTKVLNKYNLLNVLFYYVFPAWLSYVDTCIYYWQFVFMFILYICSSCTEVFRLSEDTEFEIFT